MQNLRFTLNYFLGRYLQRDVTIVRPVESCMFIALKPNIKRLCTNHSIAKYRKALEATEKTHRSTGFNISGLFMLIFPVSTFCLGVWQVKRWRWKLELIEQMEKKVGAESIEFRYDLNELSSLEYRKVRLQGTFDCSNEIVMGPRSLISSKSQAASQGLISNPVSGYHVITPFKLKGQNLTVLVNRGWIPSRKYKNFKVDSGKEVEIVAVVRKAEKRSPFMAKNVLGGNGIWFSRDVPAMATYLGTSEVFLDLFSIVDPNLKNATPNPLTPIPGQTRVTLKNDHVSYFFTWFSLSAITGYMWHRLYILKKALR